MVAGTLTGEGVVVVGAGAAGASGAFGLDCAGVFAFVTAGAGDLFGVTAFACSRLWNS
jgi:hypothetical protein